MRSPAVVKGYVSKPTWIYVLGVSFVLAPLGNFIWSLAALGVKRWWDPRIWSIWIPYVEPHVWTLMALVSLSGLCLLFVRRWSWILSLVSLGIVLVYSLFLLPSIASKASIAIVSLLMLITIGAMGVILFSPFRLPYINPRLRWWETGPRYRVDIQVKVDDLSDEGVLVDISRTGCLVEWGGVRIPQDLRGNVRLLMPMGLVLLAEVTRRTPQGYGFRFLGGGYNKAASKTLRSFLQQLAKDPTKLVRR